MGKRNRGVPDSRHKIPFPRITTERTKVKTMRVYGILLSQENTDEQLMNESIVRMLEEHHGAVVMNGFNPMKYVACFVFKNRFERDACANELRYMGVKLDTRDDGIIDDEYGGAFA